MKTAWINPFIMIAMMMFSPNIMAKTVKLTGVATCQFDMTNDTDYCSRSNKAQYRRALANQKPNFNRHYILLEVEPRAYAAIDTRNGVVYPLFHTIEDHENGKKAKIQFSVNEPQMCVWGVAMAYQSVIATDDYGEGANKGKNPVCFGIFRDEYSPKYGYEFRHDWTTPKK